MPAKIMHSTDISVGMQVRASKRDHGTILSRTFTVREVAYDGIDYWLNTGKMLLPFKDWEMWEEV